MGVLVWAAQRHKSGRSQWGTGFASTSRLGRNALAACAVRQVCLRWRPAMGIDGRCGRASINEDISMAKTILLDTRTANFLELIGNGKERARIKLDKSIHE